MRQKSRMSSAVVVAVFLLASCQQGSPGSEGNERLIGGAIGAGLGALLGSQIGGGRGQLAATAIGTLVGAYLGSEIAARLTQQDQIQMSAATERALSEPAAGKPVVWRNPDSGNSGQVKTGDVYVRSASATRQPQGLCRDVEQRIELADGTTDTVTATACQSPSGKWELMA